MDVKRLAVAAVLTGHVAAYAQPDRQWTGTSIPGLHYTQAYPTSCGRGGRWRMHYHQFRNDSSERIEFVVTLNYTDLDGKPATYNASQALDPGRTTNWGGSWRCAVPNSVRMAVKPDSSRSSSQQPQGAVLDDDCKRLLRSHSERLEAAGAGQKLLAWYPLAIVLPGRGRGFMAKPTEWEQLARGITGLRRLLYSTLASEADLHAQEHSGDPEVKKFWQKLSDVYTESGR